MSRSATVDTSRSAGTHGTGDALALLVSAVAATCFFFWIFGWQVLRPGNVDWMLARGDPATHYLGWLYFRQEPWQFPVGKISNYLYPLGASICLTDSLPILALPLKLVARWLPAHFQFFGFWILLSLVLQAVFGYLVARLVLRTRRAALLAMLFFVLSPIMMYRQKAEHIALASHWLILWGLLLVVRRYVRPGGRPSDAAWLVLIVVSTLIHPYLTVMNLVLAAVDYIALWRQARSMKAVGALSRLAGLGALVYGLWYVLGYFVYGAGENMKAGGYGTFALNILAPLNPFDTSSFVPPLPVATGGQYEGYAYLGLGGAVLVGSALLLWWRRSDLRQAARSVSGLRVLAVTCLLLTIYAISSRITIGGIKILSFKLVEPFETICSTFRASGRFFWPVYYCLLLGSLAIVRRHWRDRTLFGGLVVALLAQAADMLPGYTRLRALGRLDFQSRLRDPEWERYAGFYNTVVTYPPYEMTTQFFWDFRDLGAWCGERGIRVGAGYVARVPADREAARTSEIERAVRHADLDPRTLLIVERAGFGQMLGDLARGYDCRQVDGFLVCHTRARGSPEQDQYWRLRAATLGELLAGQVDGLLSDPDDVVLLVLRSARGQTFGDGARRELAAFGSQLAEPSAWTEGIGYVAVFRAGRFAREVLSPDRHAESFWALATSANAAGARPELIRLFSLNAVKERDRVASILRGGRELAFNGPGLSAVVVDGEGRLRAAGCFGLEGDAAGGLVLIGTDAEAGRFGWDTAALAQTSP